MNQPVPKVRIESIDLLKGLVMVIMALDHTRDYTHAASYLFSPTDPAHTSWAIYFTRWITHFCAPAFSFLAGLSAYMVGRRKPLNELSAFLFKRGLWLIFIELTVVNFAWYFDIHFRNPGLIVIWSLGVSMIVLAGLVYLPRMAVLIFSCILIFGHNLLDGVHFEGSILWSVLHEFGSFKLGGDYTLNVYYPLIPWIGVMSLGYCFGNLYDQSFAPEKRKRILNIIGISAIILFVIARWLNVYGDPRGWKYYDTFSQTLMSFMNPVKYPPSLLYMLMTLGPLFLVLANSEKWKGRIVDFFSTFGRVPFFFYIIHIYLIHLTGLVLAQLTGFGWRAMILTGWPTDMPALRGFGVKLWFVYLVWMGVIAITYPLCKKFGAYKMSNKQIWWLSYL